MSGCSGSSAPTLEAYLGSVSGRFEAAELFYGHGTDNAWDEAVYLVFTALGIGFDSDSEVMHRSLTPAEVEAIERLVERRIRQRVPVAYLVGEAWFAGLRFRVDERVLIPRSPLAELILQRFATLVPEDPGRILDLCTGSGCIGIACAVAFPGASVDLSDISAPALALARENIELHGLGARVQGIESDLFGALEDCRYDLIISNPPYVSREEIEELPPEYLREPELGLLSDDDGLAIPLRIMREAPQHLNAEGVLIVEVGYSREALEQRLPGVPFTWLEFACGGDGVFLFTRKQLLAFREHFGT